MQNWKRFKQQLADNHHRGLVVISGERFWCLQQLKHLIDNACVNRTLWLGENNLANTTVLNNKQALQYLGQECDQLVLNGHDGLDLNALGAITGTLKAGGVCFLLCPALTDWPQQPDAQSARYYVYPHQYGSSNNRLIGHLVNTIRNDPNLLLLEQAIDIVAEPHTIENPVKDAYHHPVYKTQQQQLAVEKIKRVALGHRRRPLVLTADRGRGKSSALGIAVAELLSEGKQKIIVSAPQVTSVQAVFERAAEQLTVVKQSATQLDSAQGTVLFIPPDELIRHKKTADLVMIDEAAAIPAPMLTQLLKQHSRIVFTSTIAGYEGTGRGFEIRFKQTLNQLTPNWQAYAMDQPIRWAQYDPLENFINQALMLNAQAAQVSEKSIAQSELKFTIWNRDLLLKDNQSLSQIIGLLTLSHYKTSPNDFRHLLDGSNIQLYTQSVDGNIVGTALIALEGNLPEDICQPIWQGARRPKGHMLPQTLSCHAGFAQAPKYRYARIIRIAVHPNLHCKGLGSQLLEQLTAHLRQQVDFVGSSFGATNRLLSFWQQNGHSVVRLGITKEATSNEYSAIVLKFLNDPSATFLASMVHKFNHELPHQLIELYPLLPAKLVIQLLQQQPLENLDTLTSQEQNDLEGYILHKREYEFAILALYKQTLLLIASRETDVLNERQQQLLVEKVLRKKSWASVCDELGFSGKKMAVSELKLIFTTASLEGFAKG